MGAGKGRSKRVQANAATAQTSKEAVYRNEKWREFTRDSKLGGVNVYEYYLGAVPQPPSEAEHEKVLEELFADAVASGTIELPETYDTSDFMFQPYGAIYGETQRVFIRFRGNLLNDGMLFTSYLAGEDHRMGGASVLESLREIAGSLFLLFKRESSV